MTLAEQIVAVVTATGCSRVVAEFLLRVGTGPDEPAAKVAEAICDALAWNRSRLPRGPDPVA